GATQIPEHRSNNAVSISSVDTQTLSTVACRAVQACAMAALVATCDGKVGMNSPNSARDFIAPPKAEPGRRRTFDPTLPLPTQPIGVVRIHIAFFPGAFWRSATLTVPRSHGLTLYIRERNSAWLSVAVLPSSGSNSCSRIPRPY